MNTVQDNLIKPFAFIKVPPEPELYTGGIWGGSLLKKLVSSKWPYEVYKGSAIQDFWSVLLSPINNRNDDRWDVKRSKNIWQNLLRGR